MAEPRPPTRTVVDDDPRGEPCVDDLEACGDTEPLPWRHVFDDGEGGCAHLCLQQRDEKHFRLTSGLRFTAYRGELPPPEVRAGELGCTDLTSVPPFLRWFIGPYGAHTPAALIHDSYIGADPPRDRSERQADLDWLQMLVALGLPPWRRWTMYAAVAARTMYHSGLGTRVRVVAWAVLSLLAILSVPVMAAVAVRGPAGWQGPAALAAVLGAFGWVPAAALWGSDYRFGWVAGLTAIWVLPPTVFVALGWVVYWAWERLMILIVTRLGAGPAPEPTEDRAQLVSRQQEQLITFR
jgi:hypothetical protein